MRNVFKIMKRISTKCHLFARLFAYLLFKAYNEYYRIKISKANTLIRRVNYF